jgi:hypothetical protein
MELWHLKQQIILSLNPCDLHKPSWTCIWYFVSQPLWPSQTSTWFVSHKGWETKYQIQVQLGLWVTRVERQNTKYRFNLVCESQGLRDKIPNTGSVTHKPSWTCIWYFVSQPLWLTNQVEPVFGILSLNPCDSQTKLNLYLDKMISLAYNTFLFSGNRLGQSYTEVEFNNVTNLTNQCVVQKIFWSVLCISPFHFVLWIPGLHE